ncbi:MAG: rhodanese-like domain-containing protein [Candidatus Eremiobacteraeota bacterium]|nr:rhodanese-like domain-containing protein [Candidatus Eremiobacteraeota bacterium]
MQQPRQPGKINVDDIKSAPEGSLTFIDVRKKPDEQQIRGSVRYSGQKLLESTELALPLRHDGTIVVYCGSGTSCATVAQHLREHGFHNAVSLEGGYAAAKEAGLPLEELSKEQPIPGKEEAGVRLL